MAMLLSSKPQGHANDLFFMFGKSHVLEGVAVVGLDICLGDNVRCPATEHKTVEALGCFVEVATTCQTFIERGFGVPEDYRMLIHGNQNQLTCLTSLRFC